MWYAGWPTKPQREGVVDEGRHQHRERRGANVATPVVLLTSGAAGRGATRVVERCGAHTDGHGLDPGLVNGVRELGSGGAAFSNVLKAVVKDKSP